MIFGTVIKGVGGLYTVRLDEEINGEKYINVRGRGAFRHEKIILLTGDRVEIEMQKENEFFLKAGTTVKISKTACDVIKTATKDFIDFLLNFINIVVYFYRHLWNSYYGITKYFFSKPCFQKFLLYF